MKTVLPAFRLSDNNTLVLRLPPGWPEQEGEVAWWWGAGASAAKRGVVARLSELPAFTRGARTQLWSPATDTLLTRTTLPTRARAKILQALPFALEEQILGEPEGQSFSYRVQEDGSLAVAVTARSRIQEWLGAVQAAGLVAISACPGTLKVPYETGYWSLAADEGAGMLRTGPMSGLACALETDLAVPMTLMLALREAIIGSQAPAGLIVFNPPAGLDTAAWSEALQLPVEARAQDYWATNPGSTPPINLLEREFSPGGDSVLPLTKLRPAAIMLAVWMVVGFGFNLWEWWRLDQANTAQQAEMLALFKRSFPEAKLVGSPAPLMERNLTALQAGSGGLAAHDLLPLLESIAPAFQATPQTRLRTIKYGEASVTLDVTLGDFQAMEAMKNALVARGLQAEVLSANSREGAVEGKVKVKTGGRT